jgi:tetratricopeptide (TPR) repeat protein
MTIDPHAPGASDVEAINAQASTLMKRGIGLLEATGPNALSDALGCFDQALELRRGLPIDAVPTLRYGLAACWLNRADALVRLGDVAQITEALRSFDEGIRLLHGLPLGADARFPRRLAMAYQNRGLALGAQGRPAGEAIAAFTEAIAILDHHQAALIPDRQYLLAVVWMNLAKARAADATAGSDSLARDAALRAIALVADVEMHDEAAAEVGLKARHVLCQAIAVRLPQPMEGNETMPDDVHEATDVADDGLGLARRWERDGVDRFRGIAYDLFRFGARVYARYQPQFLHEFVLDNMDPDLSSSAYANCPKMRSAAQEALELAKRAGH